jgi:hypothetical protein
MNQRIKQLLGQAHDQAVPETWTTLSSEQLEKVYDKFAELIVRECARVIADDDLAKESDTFLMDSWAKGMRYSAHVLYEHFGVKP